MNCCVMPDGRVLKLDLVGQERYNKAVIEIGRLDLTSDVLFKDKENAMNINSHSVWAHRISVWSVVALFGGLAVYVVCVWP